MTVNLCMHASAHSTGNGSEAQLYRMIVESAREYAIISMDLDGKIMTWNSGAEHIMGFTEAEMVGQDGGVIFVSEDKADRAHEREIELTQRDGRAVDERWHLRKDGSRYWAEGVMLLLQDSLGVTHGYLKILRDRTDGRMPARAAGLEGDG